MSVVIVWCQFSFLLARLETATAFNGVHMPSGNYLQEAGDNKTYSLPSLSLAPCPFQSNCNRKLLQYDFDFEGASSVSSLLDFELAAPAIEPPATSLGDFASSPFINPMPHATDSPEEAIPSLSASSNGELVFRLLGAVFCIFIILCTILGNVLVIIVVTRFHRMRTVTNILLAR